jgi:hypothetical protein
MRSLKLLFLLLQLTTLISLGQLANPVFEAETNCEKESLPLSGKDDDGSNDGTSVMVRVKRALRTADFQKAAEVHLLPQSGTHHLIITLSILGFQTIGYATAGNQPCTM